MDHGTINNPFHAPPRREHDSAISPPLITNVNRPSRPSFEGQEETSIPCFNCFCSQHLHPADHGATILRRRARAVLCTMGQQRSKAAEESRTRVADNSGGADDAPRRTTHAQRPRLLNVHEPAQRCHEPFHVIPTTRHASPSFTLRKLRQQQLYRR